MELTKNHKGCIEEMVILEETNELYKYSLSNNLDDIEISIYARTGCNVNLNNARWKLNPSLSISVKHMMDKHQANFSMTADGETGSGKKFVAINMRAGNLWFITGYDEVNGYLVRWDLLESFKMTIKYIEKYILPEEDDDDKIL